MGVCCVLVFLCVVGGFASVAQAMNILFPPNLEGHVSTPIRTEAIGVSKIANGTLSGLRVVLADEHICDDVDPTTLPFAGCLVLIHQISKKSISWNKEHDMALCAEQAGGVAVVRPQRGRGEPGFSVFVSNNFANHVSIPVASAESGKVQGIIDTLEQNSSAVILVDFELDTNKWKELYESLAWILFWRVFAASANALGFCFAIFVCSQHFRKYMKHRLDIRAQAEARTASLMFVASILEVCAFGIRAVYFALGPFFSTPDIPFPAHMFLCLVTVPLELATSLISVVLFMRWGAFGAQMLRNPIVESVIAVVCVLVVSYELVFCVLQAYPRLSDMSNFALMTVNLVVGVVIMVLVSVAFFVYGGLFIRAIQNRMSRTGIHRSRQLKKAVIWIMVSGIFQLGSVAGAALAVRSERFYTPRNWFIYNGLVFGGLTGTAWAQTVAFRPFDAGSQKFDPLENASRLTNSL